LATIESTVIITATDSADLTACTNYLNANLPTAPSQTWAITQDAQNLKVTATLTVQGATLA
jgi:hypothetical protein